MENAILQNIITIDRYEADEFFNKSGAGVNELIEPTTKEAGLKKITEAKKAFENSANRGEIEIIEWVDDIKTNDYWEFLLKYKAIGMNKIMSFKIWRNAKDY